MADDTQTPDETQAPETVTTGDANVTPTTGGTTDAASEPSSVPQDISPEPSAVPDKAGAETAAQDATEPAAIPLATDAAPADTDSFGATDADPTQATAEEAGSAAAAATPTPVDLPAVTIAMSDKLDVISDKLDAIASQLADASKATEQDDDEANENVF